MGADEKFAGWVRSALRHLYDFAALEKHPLASVLARGERGPVNRAQLLRRALLDAIHSLRPERSVPVQSSDWRTYRILELRYIEGLSTADAMRRIGLQKSQFYDSHAHALTALADRLWERHRDALQDETLPEQSEAPHNELVRSEVARIGSQGDMAELDVARFLYNLERVIAPLARSRGAQLEIDCPQQQCLHAVNRVLLRQSILQLVNHGLGLRSSGDLRIAGFCDERVGGIAIQVEIEEAIERSPAETTQRSSRLGVCHDIVHGMGGRLEISSTDRFWRALLTWELVEQPVLLVIDDNQGFIDLFDRYLADYSWRVVGVPSGDAARELLADLEPTVIIVDVLMPKEDGWELLVSLKADEATSHIPVIVSSVLGDPETALALGAVAYMPKPVSDQVLLRTLAPWMS